MDMLPVLKTACDSGSSASHDATEEFICVRCSRHMKTCCQTSEIYTTPGDRDRIAAYIGRRDFYEFRVPDDPVYLNSHDDDPVWPQLVFKDDRGTRRVLKRKDDGDCTFLGEHGCVLPLETRPLICRIYPFHYNERGMTPELAEGCPRELLRKDQGILEALDMNQADAERWRKQLYEDLRLELTADDYRTDV